MALRPNLVWSATRKTRREFADDRLGDPHLAIVEVEQRAVVIDAADPDDPDVDLELADQVDRRLADDAAIARPHQPAGDDHPEIRLVAQEQRDVEIVGHDR